MARWASWVFTVLPIADFNLFVFFSPCCSIRIYDDKLCEYNALKSWGWDAMGVRLAPRPPPTSFCSMWWSARAVCVLQVSLLWSTSLLGHSWSSCLFLFLQASVFAAIQSDMHGLGARWLVESFMPTCHIAVSFCVVWWLDAFALSPYKRQSHNVLDPRVPASPLAIYFSGLSYYSELRVLYLRPPVPLFVFCYQSD